MTDPGIAFEQFVRGESDPHTFSHSQHVRMGFEMLQRHSFVEAALHYSRSLRRIAARGGNPDAYHETITIAFLSLIAERMTTDTSFEAFRAHNPDLFDKHVLERWYRPERLASNRARNTFLLPEPQK